MIKWIIYLKTLISIYAKKIVNIIGPKHIEFQPFILLCAPRTGSTWLHTLLNSNPEIYSYGELWKSAARRNSIATYLNTSHATSIKAVGLKLFFDEVLKKEHKGIFNEIARNKNIKIVHLSRTNTLASFVSLKLAERSKKWSISKNSKHEGGQIHIDPEAYQQYCQELITNTEQLMQRFDKHEKLSLTYEELLENKDFHLQKIQEFLGVEPREAFSLLKKQNVRPLSELIDNYDEVSKLHVG